MMACLMTARQPLGRAVRMGPIRGMSVGAGGSKKLKILVCDGYAQKSRDEFHALGLPLASQLYANMLERQSPRGVSIDAHTLLTCEPDFQQPSTEQLREYDGVTFTGSSYSAYDECEDVRRQIQLCGNAMGAGVSVFGSCWALQIAAVALGGVVEANPLGREVGIGRKISLTEAGRRHSMYHGKKAVFEAFESHNDEVVRAPPGALVLAGNDHTRVQSMVVVQQGVESWFVQYHPEYDLEYFGKLIGSRKERMIKLGFFAKEADVDAYVQDLLALHADGGKKSIAWRYGIDGDVINPDIKEAEVRNWLRYISGC